MHILLFVVSHNLQLLQVVVETPDGAREAHLSNHTKRLYERFDPSRIRLLKTRNIRRGFEKEGMELQRPERIYDIPDIGSRRNGGSPKGKVGGGSHSKATPTGPTSRSLSPQHRPRLSTPTISRPAQDPAYSKAYQSLTAAEGRGKRSEYTSPEPQQAASTPRQSPRSNRRGQSQLPLGSSGGREVELLENRVEVLEREVHVLRGEIAKLKTLGKIMQLGSIFTTFRKCFHALNPKIYINYSTFWHQNIIAAHKQNETCVSSLYNNIYTVEPPIRDPLR